MPPRFPEDMRAHRLDGRTKQGHTVSVSKASEYTVPTDGVGLKGPMARPEPGTVPLRGDLAHIALARTYLVPHYVVPQIHTIGANGAEMKLADNPQSETLMTLDAGARFEVLDLAGDWYWGCVGPEGPSGYIPKSALAAQEA